MTGWNTDSRVRVVRVIDQSSDFLRYLAEQGCTLDTVAEVKQNSREAGVVTLKIGSNAFSLGYPAAHQILAVAFDPERESANSNHDPEGKPQDMRLTAPRQ